MGGKIICLADPGEVVQFADVDSVTVEGRVVGRGDFEKLELVHDGEVISTHPGKGL